METFATIRDTGSALKEMVRVASAGYHDEVYMRVLGDEGTVHFITQTNGRMVMSYCTFTGLDHVEGDAEAIIPVGIDNDTKGFLDYLSIAEGTGKMEMTLRGEPGDEDDEHPHLASHWEAEGALKASLRLPASQDALSKVPWGLPKRWTAENEYLSRSAFNDGMELTVDEDELGQFTPPTVIETTAESIRSNIIDPAQFMDDVNYYPIIVTDGELRLNLQGSQGDDSIAGQVNADSVAGPDVSRTFDDGFKELFGELDGAVELATAPEPDGDAAASPPLVVVQDSVPDRIVRHVLGPFSEG